MYVSQTDSRTVIQNVSQKVSKKSQSNSQADRQIVNPTVSQSAGSQTHLQLELESWRILTHMRFRPFIKGKAAESNLSRLLAISCLSSSCFQNNNDLLPNAVLNPRRLQ